QKFVADLKLTNLDENSTIEKVISTIRQLINPPTDDCVGIKIALDEAQQKITELEKQLAEKTPCKENIKEIIKIDETLLNENQSLKIELDKQINNYLQLAEQRNKQVLEQIKIINVDSTKQLLPHVKKEQIQQVIQQSKNYTEISNERNKLISRQLQQNLNDLQASQQEKNELTQQQQKERIALISALVVSLLSIGGLLAKLK